MADPSKGAERGGGRETGGAGVLSGDPFAPLLADMYNAALSQKGELSQDLRRAAAQNQGLPPALAPVVDKIARHAYRVTDEDIASLKAAGYSEDQIYEMVVSAAVGRAYSMAEKALAVLAESVARKTP